MTRALVLQREAGSSLSFFVLPALESRGYTVEVASIDAPPPKAGVEQPDLVVLVRYWPRAWAWRRFLWQAKRSGVVCVLFIDDDLLDRGAFAPLPRRYARRLMCAAWRYRRRLLRWCDQLWVSSAALAQRYGQHQPELLPLQPLAVVCERKPSVQIAYHGTGCHRSELIWLFPVLAQLQQSRTDTVVELYGDDAVARLYAEVPRLRVHRPLRWERYRELTAAQSLDLLLCPLLPHPFNTARAAVKVFDAMRMGAVGVYSNREPYASVVSDGVDGVLIGEDDPRQWLRMIHKLVDDPGWRQAMASAAEIRVRDSCLVANPRV